MKNALEARFRALGKKPLVFLFFHRETKATCTFSHPDCNRRPWIFTKSVAHGFSHGRVAGSDAAFVITAGQEFHPALKVIYSFAAEPPARNHEPGDYQGMSPTSCRASRYHPFPIKNALEQVSGHRRRSLWCSVF
jgi:hypothetical protein